MILVFLNLTDCIIVICAKELSLKIPLHIQIYKIMDIEQW